MPEVETIKRDLSKKICGLKITAVKISSPRVIKEPAAEEFAKLLKGDTVQEVLRAAKILILGFKSGRFLIIHLRISGWLLYGKADQKARVQIEFDNGAYLNYMDGRLLGHLRLRQDWKDLKFIRELGKEPFDQSPQEFAKNLENKKTRIKPLLLDQTFIAGIGNIYAQEALFSAGIDPCRAAGSLSGTEAVKLHKAIVDVLNQGIKYRGSSVDAYRDPEGNNGGMEKHLKVYGRQNQPCPVCARPVQKIVLCGRGTCFCGHCQK